MLKRAVLLASCFVFLVAAIAPAKQQQSASGQEKPAIQPSPAPVPAPAPASRSFGQPVAVRIDLTITDQVGTSAPVKKTMTMMAADGERASVRSMNRAPRQNGAQFNVDAKPMLVQDKIRLDLSIFYDPPDIPVPEVPEKGEAASWSTTLQESMGVILENGKPTVISQSADPRTDRKVSVEVKATILK
jgi:hypothetical protein